MCPRKLLAIVLLSAVAIGCRSAPRGSAAPVAVPSTASQRAPIAKPSNAISGAEQIQQTTLQEPLPAPEILAPDQQPEPIEFAAELSLEDLIAGVESRYPSLDAMLAAWQAAAQRYPQVIALDDPMFMGMTAPASWSSPTAEAAYLLELRQKYPWFGKRPLRGTVAQQEANAAYHEFEDARLALRQMAQSAYYDFFLASRQRELNTQNLELQGQFRETAYARYGANQTTVQDVLQADVELADLKRRQIELQRQHRSSIARINILLRQPPFTPLPPPARVLEPATPLPDVEILQQSAVAQRPDLAAVGHRVQAAQASLALAHKQYYPDVDVFGRYDTFWQPASEMGDLRAQAGFAVNLPVYHQKLRAAVAEAQAQLARRNAEYHQKRAEIEWEVQSAYLMTDESIQLLAVYKEQLIPAAKQNVAAVRANYEAGKASFLDLAQANRQLIMMQEREIEAVTALHQRRSQLDRVVGGASLFTPQ